VHIAGRVTAKGAEEIAATLQLPMGTLKSRLARARRMLGEAMGGGPRPWYSVTGHTSGMRQR